MVHFASSSDGRVVSMEIESGIVNQDFVYYFKNEFECLITVSKAMNLEGQISKTSLKFVQEKLSGRRSSTRRWLECMNGTEIVFSKLLSLILLKKP